MSGDGACTGSQPGTETWPPIGVDCWKFKTCISTAQRLSENKLWRSSDSHLCVCVCVCANTTWYTSNKPSLLSSHHISLLYLLFSCSCIPLLCCVCNFIACGSWVHGERKPLRNMKFQGIWWQLGLYYFWGLKPFKTESSSWSDFEYTVQGW